MRTLHFGLTIVLLAAVALFATDIPKGTKLTVRTSTMASSDRSSLGESVDAILVSDLVVNGKVVAPQGTAVQGTISGAEPSTHGKVAVPGSVSIRLDSIDTPEGTYHLVTNDYTRRGRGRSGSPISPGTGGGISVGPGGIQRTSPFPGTDPNEISISSGGLEAMIPSGSVISFKVAAVSKPMPHN